MSAEAQGHVLRGELLDEQGNTVAMVPVLSADGAQAELAAFRQYMDVALRPNVDYGVIPGTGTKPTLLKPGAQKALRYYGLVVDVEILPSSRTDVLGEVLDYDDVGRGRYVPTGAVLGTVHANCNSEEAKYRNARVASWRCRGEKRKSCKWRSEEKPTGESCPQCSGPVRFVAPSQRIADQKNTIAKMADKRAWVAAALMFTPASESYTQDVEDTAGADREAPLGICPAHNRPFIEGDYGPYCPTKGADGKWCKEKPTGRSAAEADEPAPTGDDAAPQEFARANGNGSSSPAPAAAPPAQGAPKGLCPVHNVPFVKRSTTDESTGEVTSWWACPKKLADGAWCKERPPRDLKEPDAGGNGTGAAAGGKVHPDLQKISDLRVKLFVKHGTDRKPLKLGDGKLAWNEHTTAWTQLRFGVRRLQDIPQIEYAAVLVDMQELYKAHGLGGLAEWKPPTPAPGTAAPPEAPAQGAAAPESGAEESQRPETADTPASEAPAGAEALDVDDVDGDPAEMSRDEREGLVAFCKHAIGKDALNKFEPGALLEFHRESDPKPAMVKPFQLHKLNDGDLQRYANWLQMKLDEKASAASEC